MLSIVTELKVTENHVRQLNDKIPVMTQDRNLDCCVTLATTLLALVIL